MLKMLDWSLYFDLWLQNYFFSRVGLGWIGWFGEVKIKAEAVTELSLAILVSEAILCQCTPYTQL